MHGSKSFEVRINDRDFCVGDYLLLQEYDPETETFTGRALLRQITYILQGCPWLPPQVAVMALVMV